MAQRGEKERLNPNEVIPFPKFLVDEPISSFHCLRQFKRVATLVIKRFLPNLDMNKGKWIWIPGDGCDRNGREKVDMILSLS